jgi:hypothetical protein
LLGAFTTATVLGQSSEVVDDLLNQDEARVGPTAYIVLTATGRIPEDADYVDALAYAQEQRWLSRRLEPDDVIRLGRFSKLILKAFDIPGGLMYRLTGLPRYAARELHYRDYFRGNSSAVRPVSGEFVLRIVGRALERTAR